MSKISRKIGEIGLAGAMMLSPETVSAQTNQQSPEKTKRELKSTTVETQLSHLFTEYEELCQHNYQSELKAINDPVYQTPDNSVLKKMFLKYANMYRGCSDGLRLANNIFRSYQRYLTNPASKDLVEDLRLEATSFRHSIDPLISGRRIDELEDKGELIKRANITTVTIDSFIKDMIGFSEQLQKEFDGKGLSNINVKITK
ncbi:MAG: hypothetical protein P4L79_07790 [Legionella sp.]|uniref:hypothetical protein n=1 Tax=Legionella sp. TaxID=459 RepID=UPI00284449C1|nr:hypothetical protein [Legionella sp.]